MFLLKYLYYFRVKDMLIERDEIKNLVDKIHADGKTVVCTNGCFDILHVGHVRYLQKTKSFADYSIVLLNSDKSVRSIKGPTRPINSENDRAEILSALSCVDYVVLFDEDSPRNLLDEIKPDVYTKGADYTLETLPEADIMKKNNTRVEFITFVEGKSTTSTINKMKNN
ncbi:MAG: D-glycero-beta-D-manno-heptose 1-phosphate adenylyltransferase [Brachyspira sp.]|nr:D-glycero-beta-D-manno-heptose 1-phosphate adenylyltransferase [Brachyspira sp.]